MSAHLTSRQLSERLARLHRVSIAQLPTPLHDLPRLSKFMGGPRILAKREDLTGLAFGGNKARHYEYQIPNVKDAGFDTLINVMDYHSNNARMTAAAANKTGLRYILVLQNAAERKPQGNLLVEKLLSCEIHLLNRFQSPMAMEYAREIKSRLEAEGYRPYLIQDHLFPKLAGVIAYIAAGLEMLEQIQTLGLENVHIIGVCGRSMCGLVLTARNLGLNWRFTSVRVEHETEFSLHDYVFRHSEDIQSMLDLPHGFGIDDMRMLSQYVGEGYGTMTEAVAESIYIAGKTEGIICDPNYTGTAMAALIDQVRNGGFRKDETVIMLHTGGFPAIFTFSEKLLQARTGTQSH